MNLEILPNLSKDYILQFVSQEQIFERYLGVPVEFGTFFNNPLRTDRNPTCSFKWSGNKLRMKDWSGYFWGDCFDLVGLIEGFGTPDKLDKKAFMTVLERIAKDFSLHKFAGSDISPVRISRPIPTGELANSIFYKFEVYPRTWDKIDAKFWLPHGIYRDALAYFNVHPVQELWINDRQDYVHVDNDPAYAYYWGKDEKHRDLFKIYFPLRKKVRFKMNCNVVEGLNKITPGEICIITKSYKDVMAIKCLTHDKYDINAIAPPSESHLMPKKAIEKVWADYKYVASLMDFDYAGRNMAWRLKATYNISPLFLTNGKTNTKNYGSKDFSAYVKDNPREKVAELLENAYSYIKTRYKYEADRIKLG